MFPSITVALKLQAIYIIILSIQQQLFLPKYNTMNTHDSCAKDGKKER